MCASIAAFRRFRVAFDDGVGDLGVLLRAGDEPRGVGFGVEVCQSMNAVSEPDDGFT